MRFSGIFASLTVLGIVLASPTTLKSIKKYNGEVKAGSFVVTLKAGADKKTLVKSLGLKLTHDWKSAGINGFAGQFSGAALNALRASDAVEAIAEDGIVHAWATQTDAPWGLSRLISTEKLANTDVAALNFTYEYDDSAGAGVDVYVVDTGVYIDHTQFGGRARWGATFGGHADKDGNGHGTHCAGTIGGSQYGVAKAVNIIAVKVLSDGGSGTVADVVSGMDYALTSAQASGRPSVVSMSLGGGGSQPIDDAAAALTAAGVHLVVAAGNSNADAMYYSPARAPTAITVGATTIGDARASFSNYGSLVDIFAPGQDVISAWIGNPTATKRISGTSMATPHVAGLVAYLIGLNGNQSPEDMSNTIKSLAVKDALTGLPSGTINALAHHP